MNKHQKEQIIDTIHSLINDHEIIFQQIPLLCFDDLYQMFTECQNTAIWIGNRIEFLEGEGTTVIKLLEDYCEMLYQCSISLESNQNLNQYRENLDNILIHALNIIENEIPTKFEIVFLPYKASMWDSLESIWAAAKGDPLCSCRVIPIPYYDKNPDGSFNIMHDETDEFPEYVPVIHYQQYDLKENKPDIIYFHNPYDKFNHVTSVHPSFYSSELKNCTNLLIYVPYFVSDENLPNHLCETMGVFMADKVIVQSEAIKEIYQKAYIEALGKEQKKKEAEGGSVNSVFWDLINKKAEEKFLALGSPKIDKVLYHMKHYARIPKEWEKIIRQRSGKQGLEDISEIKIILYNTSITDLLFYREKAIRKMKYVIEVFKKRKDAVLLWRPHPLNEATMKSMAPGIYKEYLQIIEEYRQKAYGIYDDSADIHRAISLADAYYGDSHSSIIEMFGITGKPIMFQDMEINEDQTEEERYSIGFEDFAFDGEFLWFADINRNGLYRMDIQTKETEFIAKFPGEADEEKRLYISCTLQEDNIVFAPFNANNVAIYNIKTKTFSSMMTNNQLQKSVQAEKYAGVIAYKNNIFMLPCFSPSIACFSLNDFSFHLETGWINEEWKKLKVNSDDIFYRRYLVIENRYLLIPLYNTNAVLEFDMETGMANLNAVGREGNSYSGICYDGSNYWLSPRHYGSVIRWDRINNTYIEYDDFPIEYKKCNFSFNDIVYCSGYVWMVPLNANIVIKINPRTGKMETVPAFQSYLFPKKKFQWIHTDGDKIVTLSVQGNTILTFDPANNEIQKCFAVYPKYVKDEIKKKGLSLEKMSWGKINETYYIYTEDYSFPLDNIIKNCLNDNKRDERAASFRRLFNICNEASGERIHKVTIGMVENKRD